MRIAITGANGFVGTHLKKHFEAQKKEVVSIKRDELKDIDTLVKVLENVEVVINLAGATISKRWSRSYKDLMFNSRINTTKALVAAFDKMDKKPALFISTSAVGIYEAGKKHTDDEYTYGEDFLAHLAFAWEREALKADTTVRTIIFRFGVVLGKGGGALSKMLPPFKLGFGGTLGDGKQAFPWIHIDDLVKAYDFVMDDYTKYGVYNLVAPHSDTNEDLTNALGEVLDKPTFMSVPEFVLKLRFGEGASILLKGQDVYPSRLLKEGFEFEYPNLHSALRKSV